jgi:hypothetical protein
MGRVGEAIDVLRQLLKITPAPEGFRSLGDLL